MKNKSINVGTWVKVYDRIGLVVNFNKTMTMTVLFPPIFKKQSSPLILINVPIDQITGVGNQFTIPRSVKSLLTK